MMVRHFPPLGWGRSVGQAGLDLARLGVELPQQLRRLLSSLQRGDLEVAVRPTGFEPLLRRIERTTNRLLLGILAPAFLVAPAVLLSAHHRRATPRWVPA